MNIDGEIYSISQLNRTAKFLLEERFPLIWVEGEISNFSRPSSGHWYFSLKDETAQIRCAMFMMRNRATGFTPRDGMRILARAKVSLYEGRGDFQLIIEYLEETGSGALQRAFELLKAKLAKEGLFEPQFKKPLPLFPKTVGVITSATGAAIRDILSTLKRRCPLLSIIIYPTLVQGEQAAPNIVKAVELANTQAKCDVIILARGGGSLEDLWPFNEETVARAIFASHIPIVSGVGHEIDFTIADFVADHRAATPTAAAELVSPDTIGWQSHLEGLQQRMTRLLTQHLKQQHIMLDMLTKRLRHPSQLLQEKMLRVDELDQRLRRTMRLGFNHAEQQVNHISHRLDIVNPLATLQRGYAIAKLSKTQHVVSAIDEINIDDEINLLLRDGELVCRVQEKIQ